MPKAEVYYTPVGTIKFPLTKINDKEYPYIFNPEHTEEDKMQIKFALVVDPKEAAELLAILDEQSGAIKKANFKPYSDDMNKTESGDKEKTGLVKIPFTTGYPLVFIDAKKQPCSPKIGWGSKCRVQFTTKAVNNMGKIGLGRYPRVIQIIELKSAGVDTSGFNEESGYTDAPAATEEEPWKE